MRKMFTRLFGLTLLLVAVGFITEVKAQCAIATPDGDNVEVVTDLTSVCDGGDITIKVVGYQDAEYAFNSDYDPNDNGGFTGDSLFTVSEGDPVRIMVRVIGAEDTCYSAEFTWNSDVLDPLTIADPEAEHPSCSDTLGEVTINYSGGVAGEDLDFYMVPISDWDSLPHDYSAFIKGSAQISAVADTYYVAVQSQNECIDMNDSASWKMVVVNETTPAVVLDTIYAEDPACFGDGGMVTVVASAGTPASYGYIVDLYEASAPTVVYMSDTTVNDTAVFSVPAGEYFAVVSDSVGCEDGSNDVEVVAAEEVMFDIEITDVSCADAGNGAIQVAILNYVDTITYEAMAVSDGGVSSGWIPTSGDSLINITGLDPVYYSLYVRDYTNGCDSVEYENPNNSGNRVTVQAPGEIMFTVVADSIGCFGGETVVTLTDVSGGNGSGLVFNLNDGEWFGVDTASWVLPAGENYEINGANSDGDGCEQQVTFTIVQADEFLLGGVNEISPTCPGGNDGIVSIEVMGGSDDVVYAIKDTLTWYTKSTFTTVADTFAVYAKDLSCGTVVEGMAYVEAVDNNVIALDYDGVFATDTANTCFGVNDNAIVVNVTSWANKSGEEREITVLITQDMAEVFSTGDTLDAHSWWMSTYDWYDVNDLDVGTYYLWATDDYGCVSENYLTVTITEPAELGIDATVTEHATCNNDNDGVITAKAEGGHPDDIYYGVANTYLGAWNIEVGAMTEWPEDTMVEIQAAAGSYYVVLYDDVCDTRVVSQELTVESFDPVAAADPISVTDIVCYGDSVGQIVINKATGGSGDLVYTLYLNGTSAADTVAGYVAVTDTIFSDLKAGTYAIEVTDNGVGGCDGTWIEDIGIFQPDELQLDYDVYDISCFGANDGLVELEAWGGNDGEYMFQLGSTSWQPMEDGSKDVRIMNPGTYTISIRDTFGCPGPSITFEIEEPEELVLSVDSIKDMTSACGDDDGVIGVSAVGGNTGSYEFYIEGEGSEYGDEGDVVYFTDLAGGSYLVTVWEDGEGERGCMDTMTIIVGQPDTISFDAEVTQNVFCKDGENGVITLSNIMGGSGKYGLAIEPAAGVEVADGFEQLPAGKYVITVSDSLAYGDCDTESDTLVVTEPDEYLELMVEKIRDITCAEGGQFSATATGGAGTGYEYFAAISYPDSGHLVLPDPMDEGWQTDSIFTVTEDGTWVVWAKDANGCIIGGEYDENDQVVNEWRVPIAAPSVEVTVVASQIEDSMLVCNGDMTAVVTLDDVTITVDGVEPAEPRGYTVTIDGVAVTDKLGGLGAGTYVVEVTDTLSGCTGTASVEVVDPEVLDVMLAPADGEFTCPGSTEGYIEATATGGPVWTPTATQEKAAKINNDATYGQYWYQLWQDGEMVMDYQLVRTFYVEIGHEYTVVVKDDNGCTDTSNVIKIEEVEPVVIVEGSIMDVSCADDELASLKLTVTGEDERMFQVQYRLYEETTVYDTTEWYPEGDIYLNDVLEFDNENIDDKHYEIYVVDNKGCMSDLDTVTIDSRPGSSVSLTATEGEVNGCGTEVALSAAGGVAPYTFKVDGEVAEGTVVLGGGMHIIEAMDAHECIDVDTVTLAYPMTLDTTLNIYTGDTAQFVYGDIDTMLLDGMYTFYYDVDTACIEEVNVTVESRDRMAPVLAGVSPDGDTIGDNHPILVMTFADSVPISFGSMGYLTITRLDSAAASVTVEVTEAMVSGNTVTVTYDWENDGGLAMNETYVVHVDSGVVMGDGLAWGGIMDDSWTFTTGNTTVTDVVDLVNVDFKVYPNPFNNFIRIDNSEKLDRVIISNIAGQRIMDIENPTHEIRTGNLVTGVYVVTLISNDEIVKSERIIKR